MRNQSAHGKQGGLCKFSDSLVGSVLSAEVFCPLMGELMVDDDRSPYVGRALALGVSWPWVRKHPAQKKIRKDQMVLQSAGTSQQ